jgi:transposase
MSEVKLDRVEGVGPRRRRGAEERLQIVEESYVHGMSVARVARKYGINANQVFQWRRLQQDGLLGPSAENSVKLLPVSVIEEREPAKKRPQPEVVLVPAPVGTIHIALPGRVSVRLEGSVDAAMVRIILKSLRS